MKAFIALIALATFDRGLAFADSYYTPSSWEKQIVASCLVLEASNQGSHGMRAVASVIHNRARGESSRILKEVKRPYAFSALNSATTGRTGSRGYADHVKRASRDPSWESALMIVDDLYSEYWEDITDGADHYVRSDISPSWTRFMSVTAVIGAHRFYSSSR